jgi:hypothetical protein
MTTKRLVHCIKSANSFQNTIRAYSRNATGRASHVPSDMVKFTTEMNTKSGHFMKYRSKVCGPDGALGQTIAQFHDLMVLCEYEFHENTDRKLQEAAFLIGALAGYFENEVEAAPAAAAARAMPAGPVVAQARRG